MSNQQMYGGYNPYQNWQQTPQAQPMQQQFQQPVQQMQSIGYIPVTSEDMARNYPVAPGNSLAFRHEDGNHIYVKSMGFSQYDKPIFEKYELVKENEPVMQEPVISRDYDSAIDALSEELNNIREEVEHLKKQQVKVPYKQPKRKENEEK